MTPSTLWDGSIRSFIDKSSSSSPTPGGGSVAALVAALGAAMTSMVGNLSQGEKFIVIQSEVRNALEAMASISAESEQLLDADIVSFEQYMTALKLPKTTAEQQELRQHAIQQAAAAAIDVPLNLIRLCLKGIRHTAAIAQSSNNQVVSDLGIGAILFEAAAQSALLTVEINLASLKDLQLKERYSQQAFKLIKEIGTIKEEALGIARNRILKP